MKLRSAKSRTADLFTAAVPERRPDVSRPPVSSPVTLAPQALAQPALDRPRPKQLWYAAVFPAMTQPQSIAPSLRKLCLHAQSFTSFVSIEPPNALLLEIKGSVKLFGSLQQLHADIDDCWRRLALQAHSATAPSTLAALWLARAGVSSQIEDIELLRKSLAKVPIACTAWDAERLQTLRAMGVATLSELMRLPRAGLARRLTPGAGPGSGHCLGAAAGAAPSIRAA